MIGCLVSVSQVLKMPKPIYGSVKPSYSLGERVRLVREMSALTQAEFGGLLGTTAATIHSIEIGVNGLSSQILAAIEQQTGFTEAFFVRGELPDFPLGSILYRP